MRSIPLRVKELNKQIEHYGISYHKKDQIVLLEDDKYKFLDELNEKTTEYNKQLDELSASKEKEITTL